MQRVSIADALTTVYGMDVKYAVGLPTVGEFGDVHTLLDLAVTAEQHGWDGVHLWDHVLYHDPGWHVTSPIVAAAAIAAATTRIRIILTIALPRRQVQEVAQDSAAIDALSNRRLTILATIGSMDREYTEFGLDPDLRTRGRALDERLAQLTNLWAQWGVPRIPIWSGGRWPRKPGLRRAARFNGAMPTFDNQRNRNVPIELFTQAASFVRQLATQSHDIALEGATEGPSAARQIAPYAGAGMTWWVEALGWWRGGQPAAAARITDGPPAANRFDQPARPNGNRPNNPIHRY
jgi:alkanesulfonate monooxygenase SsuD/methylene tetrahydromethanopterin reductase-like flavin-dependent oxidoreductase (luciferase family)